MSKFQESVVRVPWSITESQDEEREQREQREHSGVMWVFIIAKIAKKLETMVN